MKPACMDDAEYALWSEVNATIRPFHNQAARPCSDCPLAFFEEQRAAGCCDGFPRMRVSLPPTIQRMRRREQWREAKKRQRVGHKVLAPAPA